jgi:hypothetical protein
VRTDLATDRNACCLAYDICDLLEHLVHLVLVDVLVLIHRINHHVAEVLYLGIGVGNLLVFSKSRRQLTVVLVLRLTRCPGMVMRIST